MYVGHEQRNGYSNSRSHSQHGSPQHNHSYSSNGQNGGSHPSTRHNSTSSNLATIPPPSVVMSNMPQSGPPVLPNAVQLADGGYGRSEDRRTYELVVIQQPIRARMCGFGDKDRRPITPPPCARLIVRDADTGKEVDINEIDTSFFVLTVDLWSADGSREVNLVRHSATSPSISAAVSSSYPPPPATPPPHQQHQQYPSHQYSSQQQQQQPPPQQQQHNNYASQQQQYNNQGYSSYPSSHTAAPSPYYSNPPPPPPQAYGNNNNYLPPPPMPPQQSLAPTQQQGSGMFTRNLIGSLSASAFRLTDPDHKLGVWFILQDLSVRTEGTFRLKLNFVNVGLNGRLSTGPSSVPVLASCFSSQFQVFSAKKFPGVIESTDLSKCFATQGIKIPIRKDGPKALSRGQDYDDDE